MGYGVPCWGALGQSWGPVWGPNGSKMVPKIIKTMLVPRTYNGSPVCVCFWCGWVGFGVCWLWTPTTNNKANKQTTNNKQTNKQTNERTNQPTNKQTINQSNKLKTNKQTNKQMNE